MFVDDLRDGPLSRGEQDVCVDEVGICSAGFGLITGIEGSVWTSAVCPRLGLMFCVAIVDEQFVLNCS